MKKNMGQMDRTIRTVIAVLIVVLYFTNTIAGTLAIILGALAAVLLVTSLVGMCPLYQALGISTRKDS
jgi:quinol-cytochrome oxidoreductase complex cytochrome b subunit